MKEMSALMIAIAISTVRHSKEVAMGIAGGLILSAPILGIAFLTDWVKSLW